MGIGTFYAQIIFHRRLLYPREPPNAFHRQAVREIVEICQKQYAADVRLLLRMPWALLAAMIETEDDAEREWLRTRLQELRVTHAESAWINQVSDKILTFQSDSSVAHVDLTALLREYSKP